MRLIVVSAIIILNLAFQSTLLNLLEFNGIIPNTSLILIVTYSRLRGDIEGGIFGFVSGLLMDVYFGRIVGMYALLGFIVGFLSGKPFKDFYRRNFLTPILFVGAMTLLYELLFYMMNFLFKAKLDLFYYLYSIIIPLTIYNMVMTLIIYPIFYNINKLIEIYEKPKRKIFND